MAYPVMNGAVGTSLLIDKMNRSTAAQVEKIAVSQMEGAVYGHADSLYPSHPVSFDACKKEMLEQLYRYREER